MRASFALLCAAVAACSVAGAARVRHRASIRVVGDDDEMEPQSMSVPEAEKMAEKLNQVAAAGEGAALDPAAAAKVERAAEGYWNYGTCARKFPAVGVGGARWPLLEGLLQVQREFAAASGERVTYFDDRYAVLNSKYLSFFRSEDLARNCSKPDAHLAIDDVLGVKPLNSQFLRHLQAADDQGSKCLQLYMPNAARYVLCAPTRHEKRKWIDTLRYKLRSRDTLRHYRNHAPEPEVSERTMDELSNSNVPQIAASAFFPAAPFTLTLKQRKGASLTGGVRAKVTPAMWASSSPISAEPQQQWNITKYVPEADEQDVEKRRRAVYLCQRGVVPARCLTLQHLSKVTLQVPNDPAEALTCPGGDISQCFELDEEEEMGQTAEACAAKCDALGMECGGWEFQQAGTGGREEPSCCLKRPGFDGASCRTDACCTAFVKKRTHSESRVVKSAFVTGGEDHGLIHVLPRRFRGMDNWKDQLWRVVPLGPKVAHIKFFEGDMCLTNGAGAVPPVDGAPVWLDFCDEENADQRWTFNGFEDARPLPMETVLKPVVTTEPREGGGDENASVPEISVFPKAEPSDVPKSPDAEVLDQLKEEEKGEGDEE